LNPLPTVFRKVRRCRKQPEIPPSKLEKVATKYLRLQRKP